MDQEWISATSRPAGGAGILSGVDEWRQSGGILRLGWLTVVWATAAVTLAYVFWRSGYGDSSPALVMSILCWSLIPFTYIQAILYVRNGRLLLRPHSITHIDWRGRERSMPRDSTTTLMEGRFRGAACFFLQPPEGRQIILPKRWWLLDDPERAEALRHGLTVVKKPFLRPLP